MDKIRYVYHYHPLTKELLGSDKVEFDPVEGKPMIPACATLDAPLNDVGQNKTQTYLNGKWQAVADYRGYFGYDEDGDVQQIFELGVTPNAKWTIEKPLMLIKDEALAKIQSFSDAAVLAMTKSPTRVEVDTWPLKMIVADAIKNGERILSAGEAYLAKAQITTEDAKKAFAAKVEKNAEAYAAVAGVADYLKTAAKEAVLAANDNAEVAAALDDAKQKATDAITALKAAEQ